VRWGLAIVVLLLWLAPASAQDTGSSFGGGDFSGGGGGSYDTGGSSSSDYSGSSSSDWGSSSSGSGGGGGSMSGGAVLMLFLLFGVIIFIAARASEHRGGRLRRVVADVEDDEIDVSAISLGIDWRARRELQARFAELAATGDVKTKEGRVRLLREVTLLLRRAEQAWLYAGVVNHSLASRETAEASFRHAAADARARYKKELVRADEGGVRRTEPGEQTARRTEGEGVVVVTVVVAARREIVDVDIAADARSLRQLLSIMSSMVAHQLAALEVIWSPSAENDRMSTAELETLYPELAKIDERSIAGRVFCTYCSGPFAAELMKCPHCGAPLERRPAA
jgi:uncharacterized membrane protein